MTKVKVRNLRRGDVFDSSDGRGTEKVTSVNASGWGKGFRWVRTSRCDHNWPADRVIDVISRRS